MKQKIEEKILRSTVKLFVDVGVVKTSMDKIAENANVSKMTIYKYFGDRDSFLVSISRFIYAEYLTKLTDAVRNGIPLKNRMFTFLDILSEFSDSGKYKLSRDLEKLNLEIEDEYISYKKNYKKLLLELISSGKNDGIIKPDLDDEYIYHYIDMGVEYYQNNTEYKNKIQNDPKFRTGFFDFIIRNVFINPKGILQENGNNC